MIYLVRHGESEWNLTRRTQGQTVSPRLTRRGHAQARGVAAAIRADLGTSAPAQVITSDLVRAVETATVLAAEFGADTHVDVRLREQSLGALEGLPSDEARATTAGFDWADPDARLPGGESRTEVAARMTAALAELDQVETAIVVSHGDAIRALLAARAGQLDDPPWYDLPNGAVMVLDHGAEVRRLPVRSP